MNQYLAGIDIGTTGSKAIIVDLNGNKIAGAYREYGCIYPKPNWVEQDADMIVAAAMEAMKEAVGKSGVDSSDIKAVSLSAQRCCAIFLDSNGKQLRPMISWLDNRGTKEVEEIAEKIDPVEYNRRTGFPNSTTWLLSKMMWVRKNQPEVWEHTDKVVQMHDYFLHALGVDEYYVDYNDAGFYGFFDAVNYCWDSEILRLFEIDSDVLPIPSESGVAAGSVSAKAAELTGLAQGTVIAVGAGDQSAGSLGAGIVGSDNISISMGTAGALNACFDRHIAGEEAVGLVTCHSIKNKWLWEGNQIPSAGVFRWFRDEVAALERAEAEKSGGNYYDVINRKIAEVPAGSKGLLFMPYLAGASTPRYNSSARGTLIGMTFAHDRFCMARAVMEGITLDMFDILQSLRDTGQDIKAVRILGGPTKSEIWNQIQADVYGMPVSTLEISDAALVGAAILGGVGAGIFETIYEGVERLVKVSKTYQPIAENTDVYAGLYRIYCNAYNALDNSNVFADISKLQ